MTKLVIKLFQDSSPDNPGEEDGWSVYTETLMGDPDELQKKLDSGLAFLLDYYEHGQCIWSLSGEGPGCQWDTSRGAGLLVWESEEDDIGATTYDDRRTDAQAFVERYTQWCNGEVYGYAVEAVRDCHACGREEEDIVDFGLPSSTGYYPDDIDGMISDIRDCIDADVDDFEVRFEEEQPFGLAEELNKLWKARIEA